ncbi:MAG TPA: MerR family transcriptional regulator [Anaerolineae bacterium]|nr:MerR family transcriptional regulator [Anaerolineae bacterium]HNU02881.1 MerR family transcriptional regulator [Anaerolineae bacterium]
MSDPGSASDPQLLRPSEVAEQLGISAATLRRWSSRFSPFLDLADGDQESGSHRRYSAHDLEVLARVKQLLEQGWTYEQVASQLDQGAGEAQDGPEPWPLDGAGTSEALFDTGDADPPPQEAGQLQPVETMTPAARFLRDAIQGMADNQQIILNSQQASRDLMGVMIQDNLNLKGEAGNLRERMLELERELAEQRRRQADYRERMETRVRVLEDAVARLMAGQMAPQAVPPPAASTPYPPAAPQPERRGFWSRLIGG